jgi:hypothetical protein
MCLGIGERKWGGDFRRRMMMFQSMIESILMYGAEIWEWKEQRRWREYKKIFEMGARSGQKSAKWHSKGRVQKEQAENESGKERSLRT